MEVMNFPQDWLNAYADEEVNIDVSSYQDEFENLVSHLIYKLYLYLSEQIDSRKHKLMYDDDQLKLFAFALFGCSRGAFNLSEWCQDLDGLESTLDKLTYGNALYEKTRDENALLAQIVDMAESIHNEITSER